MLTALTFLAGLALLAFAGDLLVSGAVSIARKFGVPPLVAGIFIVGFGTSAPEMLVSAQAAFQGHPGLALGNIAGSNIANVLLVLGVPALITPIICGGFGQRRAFTVMMGATLCYAIFLSVRPLTPPVGFLFLAALVGYAVYTFDTARIAAAQNIDIGLDTEDDDAPLPKAVVLTLLGLVGLPLGAHLIINSGVDIALALGVSEEVIGLTLFAIGTSLPELGAALAAALRGSTGLILGNVIGSNLFNILGAGGITAFFGPVWAAESLRDYGHWVMFGAAVLLGVAILRRDSIGRSAGFVCLGAYGVYLYGLLNEWTFSALFGA